VVDRSFPRRTAFSLGWWIIFVLLTTPENIDAQNLDPAQRSSNTISGEELCPGVTAPRCDLQSCDSPPCPRNFDTRECQACLVKNPFGGCVVRGNDPSCELAKAAQNQSYAVAVAACEDRRLTEAKVCNAAREQAMTQCQVRRAAAVAACELKRQSGVPNVKSEAH
jgi:hypothetical protein